MERKDRELKYVTSLHTNFDVREFYVCFKRGIVMEKVCKEGDKCNYYTYTLIEFIAGTQFEEVKNALISESVI